MAEQTLDVRWRSNALLDLSDIDKYIGPVTAELDALNRLANLVTLEGPGEVARAVGVLQARLTLESIDLVEAAKKSSGTAAPCLVNEDKYVKL